MSQLRLRVVGTVGRWALNALLGTVRFTLEHRERFDQFMSHGKPVVFALWHGRLLPLTYYHRHLGIATLISRSEDGEYIARVAEGWGFHVVRGSSSRGAMAGLRGLVKAARAGHPLAITPDGPRGPRQKLQPGVITAAQLSGLPIMPVMAGCSRAWWPGSWDRFCIPKPFSTVRIHYGEPRYVARDATESDLSRLARELEAEMNATTQRLDRDGGPH